MAAKVIKITKVPTTVRLEPETLQEILHYLKVEKSSLNKFVYAKVHEFIKEYRQRHPEQVPRRICSVSHS